MGRADGQKGEGQALTKQASWSVRVRAGEKERRWGAEKGVTGS